jgi:predicted ATPase/DNA-binding winged helix-turn-helix (wHTH) protein
MNLNRVSPGTPSAVEGADAAEPEDAICFGPFLLLPKQHLLLRNGEPVALGSRALLLLIAMASRAGELLGKAELLALVWPRLVVEECNLRAQIVTLRRALGDDGDFGYIVTVPGRGYRFVAPVATQAFSPEAVPAPEINADLPGMMSQIIGRDALLDVLEEQVARRRFVTITGPGGIGKTTLVLALANRLLEQYPQGVSFIDLAPVSRGQRVSVVIASALGINCTTDDPLLVLTSHLATSKTLLILDNCEHVLEDAATAVETILRHAPHCSVLITSREPLHAEGEFVHDLAPLPTPTDTSTLTAADALRYPAIRLLVERIAAHDLGFVFTDQDVQAAAEICRKLDGNALAIEIAAARVRAFGIAHLVELLDGSFRLQMTGRRTALPRHRTLSAALDWTYAMLSADEQAMLRQLSVFTGLFTLGAVTDVVALAGTQDLTQLLESLMDKSLVIACEQGPAKRYRLLETTRLYAAEKLAQDGETDACALRHATYALLELKQAVQTLASLSPDAWLEQYGPLIDTVRAALDWAYSDNGNVELGVELTLISVPLWLRLSLVGECHDWVNRGLHTPARLTLIQPRQRMLLLTVSASVMVLTYGAGEKIRQAWQQVSEDAQMLNDTEHQLRALWGLWNDRCCSNHYPEALELADRYLALSKSSNSTERELLAKRMRATALFYMADLAGARQSVIEALSSPMPADVHIIDKHFDQRIAARSLKAQIQLLQGNVGPAMLTIDENVSQAISLNHPATLWYTLSLSAIPTTLLVGHLQKTRYYLALLQDSMAGNDLHIWHQFTLCFENILLIRQGSPEEGVPRLGEALLQLHAQGDSPLYSLIRCEYAQGLALLGLEQLALEVISETLHIAQARGEHWFVPELLRIRAQLLLKQGKPSLLPLVNAALDDAMTEARNQGADFWTARIAADQARLQPPELACSGGN